jgi:hypothetical protein
LGVASRIAGFLGLGSLCLLGACSITIQTGPAAPAGYVAPPQPGVPVAVAPTPIYYPSAPAPRPIERRPGTPVVIVPAPVASKPATPAAQAASAERPPTLRPPTGTPGAGAIVNVPPVAAPSAPAPVTAVPTSTPVVTTPVTPPAAATPKPPAKPLRKPVDPRSEKKSETTPADK